MPGASRFGRPSTLRTGSAGLDSSLFISRPAGWMFLSPLLLFDSDRQCWATCFSHGLKLRRRKILNKNQGAKMA